MSRAADTRAVIHTLRQQMQKQPGRPNIALADFTAPRESGVADYIGAFAVTTGIGLDRLTAGVRGASTTTTTASWPRRSPTGSPRRSPSGCTNGCAGSSGATRPMSSSTTTR